MIKKVLDRRIPQILGSYVVAGTSLVLFMDWLSTRYEFQQYYVTIALFGIVSIMPSVFILAYFHGAPGKDQWTRVEKMGIPINILFIGVIILIGNRYDWWSSNVSIQENSKPKRLIIADVTSDANHMDYAYKMLDKMLNKDDSFIELEPFLVIEKNNIYDELISHLISKQTRNDIRYYTKYQLIEDANKKGEKTQEYAFNNLDSMHPYMKSATSDFAYFPLLYKINYSMSNDSLDMKVDSYKYFIFQSLTHESFKIDGSDTMRIYHTSNGSAEVDRDDVVEYMSEFIYDQLRNFMSIHEGVVLEANDGNNILFKYDKSKNELQPRMILDVKRKYAYRVNTDNFDDFINSRMEDLISYEYHVDKNPDSRYYKSYYNDPGPNSENMSLSNFTKDELNSINDGTHPFYKHEGNAGYRYGYSLDLYIKIKIDKVYDSTATAIVYKNNDPNIKVRAGDIVRY